jgi:photosystem II stability/assembly factor-like uncharacterized protein
MLWFKTKKHTTMKNLFSILMFTLCITGGVFAQTVWQSHSLVSQNWPNNDVKSYGNKLYVASNNGLFQSSDNGNTWTNLTSGFTGYSDLVEIQFTNTGNIFVRKNSFGVIRSLNGGSNWEFDTTGVGSNYGTDLLYYDGTSDRVFLGVGWPKYKLYYQSPTDANWTEVTNLPTLNNFSPTQMTRKGTKLFLTDVYKRVLESSDNGITWIQKTGTGLGSADSQVGPGRFLSIGNDLYLGVGRVWKSTDDGNTWTAVDQGFPLQSGVYVDTRCLYYDGSKLYASTYTERKTFESSDNGATWTEFGGSGSWFFKAMTMHNGALYGAIHSKDSLYIYGSSGGTNNPPDAPTNLTATPTNSILLTWEDNSNNEDGFYIESATDTNGPWSLIETTLADVISYTHTGLTAGVEYFYRIKAFNAAGESSYSNVAGAVEGSANISEAIFKNLKIYPNPTNDFVTITNIPGGSNIRVTDIAGKVVYKKNVAQEQMLSESIQLVNGIYFIHIENKNSNITRKILVTK